jgi:hypothetical protein
MQKLNFVVGRLQPFTKGHLNMINEGNAPCIIYIIEDKPIVTTKTGIKIGSNSYSKATIEKVAAYIDNPVGELEKKDNELLKRPFANELIIKEIKSIKDKNILDVVVVSNVFDALDRFNKFIFDHINEYEPQYWMCGDDRVNEYSELIDKYDTLETYKGSGETIKNLLKDILKTNIGDGRCQGVSGTMARKALLAKDKEAFNKVVPDGAESMFDEFIEALEKFKKQLVSL